MIIIYSILILAIVGIIVGVWIKNKQYNIMQSNG